MILHGEYFEDFLDLNMSIDSCQIPSTSFHLGHFDLDKEGDSTLHRSQPFASSQYQRNHQSQEMQQSFKGNLTTLLT
jgi:hypothetical protein